MKNATSCCEQSWKDMLGIFAFAPHLCGNLTEAHQNRRSIKISEKCVNFWLSSVCQLSGGPHFTEAEVLIQPSQVRLLAWEPRCCLLTFNKSHYSHKIFGTKKEKAPHVQWYQTNVERAASTLLPHNRNMWEGVKPFLMGGGGVAYVQTALISEHLNDSLFCPSQPHTPHVLMFTVSLFLSVRLLRVVLQRLRGKWRYQLRVVHRCAWITLSLVNNPD